MHVIIIIFYSNHKGITVAHVLPLVLIFISIMSPLCLAYVMAMPCHNALPLGRKRNLNFSSMGGGGGGKARQEKLGKLGKLSLIVHLHSAQFNFSFRVCKMFPRPIPAKSFYSRRPTVSGVRINKSYNDNPLADLNTSGHESGVDGDDMDFLPRRTPENQGAGDSCEYTCSESEESVTSVCDEEPDDSTATTGHASPHQCRWRKRESPEVNTEFLGEYFPEPTEEPLSSYNYFKSLCGDNLINHIAQQTNLYSMQQSSIGTSKREIEQFIGILVTMSFMKLPVQRILATAHKNTGNRRHYVIKTI